METPRVYKYIVAEDEPLILRNVVKKITALGLPVELAGGVGDGQAALELVETRFPEFVITDIRMPVMDGLKLVRRLYEKYPQTRCIILSGYDDFKYAQEALKYGVTDFLLKPVKPEELKSALQRVIVQLDAVHKNQSQIEAKGLSPEQLSRLILDYLRTNYRMDISMSGLSEKFGFSPEYLAKIFKKYVGETPLKYVAKLRIGEAKQMLINEPEMEVKKIGEYVGYPDGFYFSRVFKANTGEYPSEYRAHEHQTR